jgi:hypothetical protein
LEGIHDLTSFQSDFDFYRQGLYLTTIIAFLAGLYIADKKALILIDLLSLIDIVLSLIIIGVLRSLLDTFDLANMELIKYAYDNNCSDGPLQRDFKILVREHDKTLNMIYKSIWQYYLHIGAFLLIDNRFSVILNISIDTKRE